MDFSEVLIPYAWLWWTAACLYNPAVSMLQRWHVPWQAAVRKAWGLWNIAFAAFSCLGFIFTSRVYLETMGQFSQLCIADSTTAAAFWSAHYSGTVRTWVLLFIISKLFELGDTLFLAALDKPIIFLHWYHHLTILAYMFIGGVNWHPFMISGVVWNYGVHTVMYSYYASACFGLRWPKALARQITTLQLVQMLANLALMAATFYHCGVNNHISAWPSVAMYSVYGILFWDLYRQRYNRRPPQKSAHLAKELAGSSESSSPVSHPTKTRQPSQARASKGL